jgi:hypothetical protein
MAAPVPEIMDTNGVYTAIRKADNRLVGMGVVCIICRLIDTTNECMIIAKYVYQKLSINPLHHLGRLPC